MSDFVMAIAKYINSVETPELVMWKMQADGPGNNLFVHGWPDAGDHAARLMRYGGTAPSETFSNPLHTRRPSLQISLRGQDAHVILKESEDIMDLLTRIKDQTLFGIRFQRIQPVGEPFEIGPDSSGREVVVTNYNVSFYDS